MSQFQQMFDSMGSEAFSQAIGQVAPFFSTIDSLVVELKKNYCEVHLKKQKKYLAT